MDSCVADNHSIEAASSIKYWALELGVPEKVIFQGVLTAKKNEAAILALSNKVAKDDSNSDYYGVLANNQLMKIIGDADKTVDDSLREERICPRYIIERCTKGEEVMVVFYELTVEDYENYRSPREAKLRRELAGYHP